MLFAWLPSFLQASRARKPNMNAKLFVAVTLLGLGFGIWGGLGHGSDAESKPALLSTVEGVNRPAPAPEFSGVTTWVNSAPLKLADLRGKVAIVHFWTNGCINCIHNYPHYRAWTEKYQPNHDLIMVGVHTPEFDAEKNVDRIKDQAAKNHLAFPIAVDNEGANWKAWGNHFWPCIYLVDKAGNVRYRWDGELGPSGFKKVFAQIDTLLAEPSPKLN